jgi:site-specific recombinase XerC
MLRERTAAWATNQCNLNLTNNFLDVEVNRGCAYRRMALLELIYGFGYLEA